MREESGFTLVELLVTCVLMLVVLGATLTALESFQSNAETNVRQNDSQDEARRATDQLARDTPEPSALSFTYAPDAPGNDGHQPTAMPIASSSGSSAVS